MKKLNIFFIADTINDNFQINKIINDIEFKHISLNILYTNNSKINNKLNFNSFFFNIVYWIKNKFLNSNCTLTKNKKIKSKKIFYLSKKNLKVIKFDKDGKSIKTDIIIDLINFDFKSKILLKSKYGIWYINHNVKNYFDIGFFDCLNNKKIYKISLINKKFIKNKYSYLALEDAYLNNKVNFWQRNRQFILEKSCILIVKNLNKIYYNLNFNYFPLRQNFNKKDIKIPDMLFYFFNKYFIYLYNKVKYSFLIKKNNLWSIHISKFNKNFLFKRDSVLKKYIRFNSNTNEEWADPFIFFSNNKEYIFFENNDLDNNKAKISVGEYINNKLCNVKDILRFKYHLSYPFVWKHKKDFYLMPETSENKSITIWKATHFPYKWKIYKTIFNNEFCCDSTIIKDKKKINWLFTNKSNDSSKDATNELYIYKIIGNFKNLIPHKMNPVIIDCRIARNAGYLNIRNKLLRVSQINDSTGYGIGLNINNITELNINSYKEKIVNQILPKNFINADGLHHISNSNKYIVFDVRYRN